MPYDVELDVGRANYANEKSVVQDPQDGHARQIVQAYEKVAAVVSRTRSFVDDERRLREAVAAAARDRIDALTR